MRVVWRIRIFICVAFLAIPLNAIADERGCLFCHEGIEPFSDGGMMAAIQGMARPFRDPGGCVICHGGTPSSTVIEVAHAGAPAELTKRGGADASPIVCTGWTSNLLPNKTPAAVRVQEEWARAKTSVQSAPVAIPASDVARSAWATPPCSAV